MRYVVIFLEHDNRFLFLKRSPNEIEGNKWGMVGGAIEKHETPSEAIIREIYEEVRLNVNKDNIVMISQNKLPFNNNTVEFFTFHTNLSQLFEPELDLNESQDSKWFTFEEIYNEENLVSGLQELLDIVREKFK